MPAWKNPNLPVALKPCPRCKGTGRVPKPGGRRDELVEESMAWARSWHGEMVVVTHHDGRQLPGLATFYVERGGWGAVRVFMPKAVYQGGRHGFNYAVTEQPYGSRFPYYTVPKRHSDRLSPLLHWDETANDLQVGGLQLLEGLTADLEEYEL